MLHKVTRVFATDKKKDGTTITNKWGKVSWRTGIKVESHGDRWVNGFVPFNPKEWEGKEVEMEITEVFNEQRGENELKFELPKKGGVDNEALKKLEERVFSLEVAVKKILAERAHANTFQTNTPDTEEISPDDIPF